MMIQAMGPLICATLVLLWWLTLSRARWFERLAGLLGVVGTCALIGLLVHPSMVGIGTMFLTIPVGMAAFGGAAILFRNTLNFRRTAIAILLATVGFSTSLLLRNEGMWSDAKITFFWRWTPTSEELLVTEKQSQPKSEIAVSDHSTQWLTDPEWPAFRGVDRRGRQRGPVVIGSDVSNSELIWRIPVGPGWSSFSVAGKLLFTQEQRGDFETVVCYDAETGKENWVSEVKTRFHEPIGGPGPRGTPTLATITGSDGVQSPALFALGANGALVRLDPMTGALIWKSELREIADREPPTWGFSSSPLVVDATVIVHAGGPNERGTLAFDVGGGDLKWSAPSGNHTYSSPQLSEILGESLLLMLSNDGLEVLSPEDGSMRLNYPWQYQGYRVLQPLVIDKDSVIIPTGMGAGTRRIRLKQSGPDQALEYEDVWTSMNLKPDFNDCVVYKGYLYGFDGSIFTCLELESGERRWKGGRYGKGQVLLLEDSGLLLVLSEAGEVIMLEADPAGHRELDRFQALEGKTWNHPVVVGDRLYLRNAQEAACYRLPTARSVK